MSKYGRNVHASMLGGRITRANLDPAQVTKVLDIGCGTGAATITLAQHYPSATVYGLDISRVPDAARAAAPANVSFIEGDFLTTFPAERDLEAASPPHPALAPSTFTHLYGRMLILGIPSWPAYFATAHRLLAPAVGVLEHHDVDLFWRSTTAAAASSSSSPPPLSDRWPWARALHAALAAAPRGFDMRAGSNAARRMRDAGFVDVRSEGPFAFAFTRDDDAFPESGPCADYGAAFLGRAFRELVGRVLEGEVEPEVLRRWVDEDVERDMFGERGVHFRYWVTVGRKPGVEG
ncbi:hypothetical protein GTA08_BOTSDO09740 [Neofusicoccum parvum]|nr:hypothetical protein GTA08_BOTSDO09740 [Neofusicoccum parvum]